MFDRRHYGKVKNDKIMRWRLELSDYSYDIVYRAGNENIPADALSRSCATSSDSSQKLYDLHVRLY